jgi:hypothetical protein
VRDLGPPSALPSIGGRPVRHRACVCKGGRESVFQGQCSLEFTTQTRRLFSGAIQIHSHPSHGSNSISGTGPLPCLINGLGKAGCGPVHLVDKHVVSLSTLRTSRTSSPCIDDRVTKSEVRRRILAVISFLHGRQRLRRTASGLGSGSHGSICR